jgi:hypothetical protein
MPVFSKVQLQQESTTRVAELNLPRTIGKQLKKMHIGMTMYELHLSFGTIRVRIAKESVVDKSRSMGILKRPARLNIIATFVPKITSWKIIECTFNQRYNSINAGIQTFNLRSGGSPIFDCAGRGDLQAVRGLIESGRASPNDVEIDGWTVLHVSPFFSFCFPR